MDSFYVVLPSNSGDVEGNTTSRFTVRMPDTLELDSSWTVALSNIIYPFSFSLLGDSDEQESITIYRRYGKELLSVRIEIPDLSFASEEALEEALNAVLLDAWKKELDREREEMRLEENKKRIYGNFRKRRAVATISEQLDKNGYFDLTKEISFNFMKYLGKEGIRLPPIRPHEVDGISMVRFTPKQDQKERIKQALDEFNSVGQTESVPSVDETPESTSQTHPEQKEALPAVEDVTKNEGAAEHENAHESIIQQLEKEGHFDMPKDFAYKFIQYLNKEIKGAKLPVVSSVPDSSVVRLKPQTDQKDIIINAIKSFASRSAPKPENPLPEDEENPEKDTHVHSQVKVENQLNKKTDSSSVSDISKTDDPPIPMSRVSEAPTDAPVASEEKPDDTQQVTEKQNNKTPLDGKITPLSDSLPPLTDEQKTLMGMAVRAATRSLTNSEELAKQQAQLNKELNQKYWEDARYKYAVIDEEVTLNETGVTKRKIPATIIKWVITQLKLLVGRRNEIDKWIQECLEAKDRVSEAQIETKKSESRGDVTEARKAADRAKAAEQKVKELANQVDEAIAGQKLLSEEIIGKVEAELSNETSSSKIATPDDEETSSHEEENLSEHESEEPQEPSEDKQENAKEPSKDNIEEESETIDGKEEPSEDKYERDEETSAHAEDANVYEEHEQEDIEEPHETSEEEKDEGPSAPAEERVEDEAETIDEVTEEPSEETQDKDEGPSAPEDENVEEAVSTDVVAEEPSEETQEKDEGPSAPEEENVEEAVSTDDVAEEPSEETQEKDEEPSADQDKNIEKEAEAIDKEVSPSEETQEKDEETSAPAEEENVEQEAESIDGEVAPSEDTHGNECENIEQEHEQEKSEEKSQEFPTIIEEEPWTPPEKVNNLPTIEEEPEQEEIQPEDLSSLPALPRPEMLIADPPERPSFWKSFFGNGVKHVEDKTKEKELPKEENQQKESEVLKDSEPKKIHLAEYAYPPEYLKMLLSFSNIQLADPKYQWVSILYDKVHKRFHVFLQGNVQFIKLSRQLAYTLGFDSEKVHSGQVAKYMPDISGGVRQFLVYAPKLVENSIIGNVTAPLLRVVNVSGKPGESISEVYMTEAHHRLLGKRHPDITIEIRTLTGKLVKFHWGTCILTLHFQRSLF
uniref:Uncharacterized protein n=1 Tax=Meloidogyne enterolobii TaxID=390850 RepID=A0A6V7Y0E7_MELEN|nr:unnamed protein product [Meloidogyne enterolobii]